MKENKEEKNRFEIINQDDPHKYTPQTPEWEEIAKEIVGKWGYEEEYWWKPIAESLSQAEEIGRRRGIEEVVNDVIKMADKLESDCNLDEDKGVEQWRNFKGFRNTIRDRYLTNMPNKPLKT